MSMPPCMIQITSYRFYNILVIDSEDNSMNTCEMRGCLV